MPASSISCAEGEGCTTWGLRKWTKIDFSTSWEEKKIIYQKSKIAILLKSKIQGKKRKGRKNPEMAMEKRQTPRTVFTDPAFLVSFFPSHFVLLTPWELRAASCASVTLVEWLVMGTAYAKPVLDGEKRKKQV